MRSLFKSFPVVLLAPMLVLAGPVDINTADADTLAKELKGIGKARAEAIVAFRNENVFVSPDMYTFAPGGGLYVEAANGFMKDQFLFGSSFPFRPMGQGVADFRGLGLSEEALDAALWRNADRLLGLGLAA